MLTHGAVAKDALISFSTATKVEHVNTCEWVKLLQMLMRMDGELVQYSLLTASIHVNC